MMYGEKPVILADFGMGCGGNTALSWSEFNSDGCRRIAVISPAVSDAIVWRSGSLIQLSSTCVTHVFQAPPMPML
jgi:hypothetical protein